jgi:hypothetical protein
VYEFSSRELGELKDALRALRAGGTPLAGIDRKNFALPSLAHRLDELRRELLLGRGFALLRGLRPEEFAVEEQASVFWGIGSHLGNPRAQNAKGHLLGHVTDLGKDPDDPSTRIYQTTARQGFHTDSADLVGLLCLRPAREGGRSALVSCATLHNEMLRGRPELLAELFAPFCTDHRGEYRAGALPYFTAPILSWCAGELSVLYQRRYIESAQRFAGVPRLTARQVEALDAFDGLADDPSVHLEMNLAAGDMQFIHNHQMLHDRTAFVDWPEPDRRRHLLRLWLSPNEGRVLPPWFAERFGSLVPGERGGVDAAEPCISLTP